MRIRILRGCGASGRSLVAGRVYAVPADVSRADADLLIRLGKAEKAAAPDPEPEPEPAPKPSRRGAKDAG